MDLLKYAGALVLAGCFSPSLSDKYACDSDGACPPGLSCVNLVCTDAPRVPTRDLSGGALDGLPVGDLAMQAPDLFVADMAVASPDLGAPDLAAHDLAAHDLATPDLTSAVPDLATADMRCKPIVCTDGNCDDGRHGCGGGGGGGNR